MRRGSPRPTPPGKAYHGECKWCRAHVWRTDSYYQLAAGETRIGPYCATHYDKAGRVLTYLVYGRFGGVDDGY